MTKSILRYFIIILIATLLSSCFISATLISNSLLSTTKPVSYTHLHPESDNKINEMKHLKKKVIAGTEILLSQLFFDNEQFFSFVEECRIADINIPIIPGIMPVINTSQIKRMVTLCGATFPERFQKIILKYENNKKALFDAGIAYALSQVIDLLANDIDGIHLYTCLLYTS